MMSGAVELSCYTAPLVRYLAGEYPDARAVLASTLCLAVRDEPGGPVFCHHRGQAGLLADGRLLRYMAAPTGARALAELGARANDDGRVIVVTAAGALPWSAGYRRSTATHWLLVDGLRGDRWHVVDDFRGLLPDGQQERYSGWLSDTELIAAMSAQRSVDLPQRNRDRYSLGATPQHPPAALAWLAPAARETPAVVTHDWLTGLNALAWLADWVAGGGAGAAPWLDDIWTAVRHYRYRLGWLAAAGKVAAGDAAAADEAWRALPMALRFAVDSARRGKRRASLVRLAFEAAAQSERRAGTWQE